MSIHYKSNSQEFSFSDPSGLNVGSEITFDSVQINVMIRKLDNLDELSKNINSL